ncbi:MAG TPA: serine hydrolase domain-containing protein [Anaeromyxobacter sp.]|nr:serine hydrolase domain-containing protein [Anaeromyxobacter sp.]
MRGLLGLVILVWPVLASSQRAAALRAAPASGALAPATFTDPQRREKLARAFPEIDALLAAVVRDGGVPGLAWGVVVDGELVHRGAAGVRDVATGAPVEPDTVFRIASMTKSFTAAAVLRLRDDGKLRLDDPVSRFVPELRGTGPTRDSRELTVRDLLTHAQGFPEDNAWGDRQMDVPDERLTAWLRAGIPRSNAPGIAWEYSNYGYALLGRIVARASGTRYRDYVDARLLAPLGMRSTRWEASAVAPAKLAKGYRRDGERWVEEPPLGDGAFGPMGGLFSSVPDLARWIAFHLEAWPPRDDLEGGPLRRSSAREMQQAALLHGIDVDRDAPGAPLVGSAVGYGYGLGVLRRCDLGHVVGHSGGFPGWGSRMRWLPDRGVGIVVLANRTYATEFVDGPVWKALAALQRTGGLSRRTPAPAPALLEARDAVVKLVGAWDEALARRIAAENLFLDEPAEKRRAALEALRTAHGACRPEGALEAENALRGRWRMACEKGWLDVAITLAPTGPPRVQAWKVRGTLPPGEPLAGAVASLAALASRWDDAAAEATLAPAVDRAALRAHLAAVAVQYGACKPGAPTAGDGTTRATVTLACERGDLDLAVALDARSGRVASASFARPAGAHCVP